MTVGHPHPPDKVKPSVAAWCEGLVESGYDPARFHCQFHLRTFVDKSSERASELGRRAIARYEEISRIGRKDPLPKGHVYDWDGMLATGRNLYGNPEECVKIINNARAHYDFDTLTNTFNFGGLPHEEVKRSMRLFAKEVMPAFKDEA